MPNQEPSKASDVLSNDGSPEVEVNNEELAFRKAGSAGSSGLNHKETVVPIGFPDKVEKRSGKPMKFTARALTNMGFDTVDPGTDPRRESESASFFDLKTSRISLSEANASHAGPSNAHNVNGDVCSGASAAEKRTAKPNIFKRISKKFKKGSSAHQGNDDGNIRGNPSSVGGNNAGNIEASAMLTAGAVLGAGNGENPEEVDEITPVVTGEEGQAGNDMSHGCLSGLFSGLWK